MSEWQPIETAPKDGTEVLVYRADTGVMLARWIAPCDFMTEAEMDHVLDATDDGGDPDWFAADFIGGGRISNDGLPTHWMPLPAPPNDDRRASRASD